MRHSATTVLAQAVCEPATAPHLPEGIGGRELVDAALRHDLLLLVGWKLRAAGVLAKWPTELADAFSSAERQAAAIDCVRQADLRQLLQALNATGVRVLPFKGAALAHTHYPARHLRPRLDTDLLVHVDDLPDVERVFVSLGYIRPPEVSGRLVTYQCHYHREDGVGLVHAYDVHWKVSNVQALANSFSFDEVWAGRVPLSSLDPSVGAPNPVHALLLALVHRAGHHPGSRRLLWLHDLHVLATGLTNDERRTFLDLVVGRSLVSIAREGLKAANNWFDTPLVDQIVEAAEGRPIGDVDPPVRLRSRTQAEVLRSDLAALQRWRDRTQLIVEHLFPPASYMRARYGVRSNALVPALHFWRIVRGAPKWFRRRPPAE